MKAIASLLWIACIAWIGCASSGRGLSLEEQTYLDKVWAFPLTFTVSKAEAEEAWGRAQSFLARFSGMQLQVLTDFVIETYDPLTVGYGFGYSIVKTPMSEEVQISVQCRPGVPLTRLWGSSDAERNAHILAYYMKTGELPYPRWIK